MANASVKIAPASIEETYLKAREAHSNALIEHWDNAFASQMTADQIAKAHLAMVNGDIAYLKGIEHPPSEVGQWCIEYAQVQRDATRNVVREPTYSALWREKADEAIHIAQEEAQESFKNAYIKEHNHLPPGLAAFEQKHAANRMSASLEAMGKAVPKIEEKIIPLITKESDALNAAAAELEKVRPAVVEPLLKEKGVFEKTITQPFVAQEETLARGEMNELKESFDLAKHGGRIAIAATAVLLGSIAYNSFRTAHKKKSQPESFALREQQRTANQPAGQKLA